MRKRMFALLGLAALASATTVWAARNLPAKDAEEQTTPTVSACCDVCPCPCPPCELCGSPNCPLTGQAGN